MPLDQCSFCGGSVNEVPHGRLVQGQKGGTFICEGCAQEAVGALAETQKSGIKVELGTPIEIRDYLNTHIIAQERLKVSVATAVYHHYKRRDLSKRRKAGDVELSKSNMLVLGPTGSGKTETFRAISRRLGVPFYVQDCSRLTQQGYVGDDTEDIVRGLVENADGDVERAEWGIVLLDEFDKIARKSGRSASGYRDITGEGVQQGLLRIIEGCTLPIARGRGKNAMVTTIGPNGEVRSNVDIVDTTNILFVCAGSFAGIEEVVSERVNRQSKMGFGGPDSSKKKLTLSEVYTQVIEDDILNFGIIPELLGRLPILSTTLELSEDDMLRVLTEPKNALIKQYQALYAMDDIQLQFDDEALREIAREAKRRPTGARSLRSVLEKVLLPYSFEAPSWTDVIGLRITPRVVIHGEAAVLLRQDRIRGHG